MASQRGGRPIRVLCSELMERYAGTEAVILNYANHFDPERIKVDFIARSTKITYKERLPLLSEVLYLPPVGRDLLGYRKALQGILPKGKYDVLWDNKNRLSNLSLLKRAKKVGVPVRAVHSHNSRWDGNFLQKAAHNMNARRLSGLATELWTCSEVAGQGMFRNQPFTVVPNAIDYAKVAFTAEGRASMRAAWGVRNAFVIGLVGRLEEVKNHRFILEVANDVVAAKPEAVFVFVGQGSLENELRRECDARGLSGRVVFSGSQVDMNSVYSAFDCLAMPSLFEGLPLTAVEAQANGLPCVLSSAITRDCSIATGTQFVSLEDKGGWVSAIAGAERDGAHLISSKAEYFDLSVQAKRLENKISEMAGRAV